MIKKLAAVTAALTIAICSFTSCSKNNDSSSTVSSTVDSSVSAVDSTTEKQTPEPSLTIDGKTIDTKNFIVCTIDGKDIDFDTFRYYYYYTISKYTSTYGATLDTIKSTDGGFELLMEDVITALKQELVAPELAEENGIKLRAPEPEDLDCMFRFENIVDLWDISNTTGPYSRFHLKQYIEQTQNDLFTDRQLRLMIENSDRQVVGIVDICNFDPLHSRAEVGIVIDEAQRRKGIGRQALFLLESHCFHYLGIHQLFAYVDTANKPCRKLFTTCGYQECALLKDWMHTGKSYRDVIMLQKINF